MSNIEKAIEFKNLGNQAFKNKKYDEAIKYFTQAIQFNPNDHIFYSNRSQAHLNAGNHPGALDDANYCIKINPTWARGYQRKGTALFYMNRISDAIEAYKEGLKHEPENQQLKNDLKAAEDKQMQSQQGLLQAYLKLANNPETKEYLSDPQFMQKVQAIMQNPQLFAMFQNDPKIKKAYDVINEGGMPGNFNFEEFMKNMQKQEPQFKKSEAKSQQKPEKMQEQVPSPKTQPKPEPAASKKEQAPKQADPAEDAKNEGNNEYKKKNFEKAIELYQKAIDLKPEEPLYYNNKAAAFIELGKYAEAHEQLNKAEKIFEDGNKDFVKKAKVLARRASLLAKQGKFEQSIATYQKSLLEDGVQKVRDQLKAVTKLKKQKQEKEYINPELAEKACQNGNTLFKQGKFPAALKQYEEAIKRNPEVAKYYSNLGTVYIKLMEFQRAKQNFEISLKKDPSYIKAYPKKADCHFFLKEYHKALETYEAGLKIDPQNQLCKAGIIKTQQAIYTAGAATTEEQKMQRAKRAMADPQIQKILQTPEVRNALADLQNNPAAIQSIMSNPSLAEKIEKLIQAGVIGTG